MNRYTAEGIARDAENGRRVLVVERDRTAARRAFEQIETRSPAADIIRRANGAERIGYLNGGRVTFTTPRSTGHRGVTADVVFIAWEAGGNDDDLIADLLPCIQTSRDGEISRA